MYRISLIRPGQPTEHRSSTEHTSGDIRDALWDLLRSTGVTISDEDHSTLTKAAGDLRDMAVAEGFGALQIEGGAALTALTVRFTDCPLPTPGHESREEGETPA